MSFPDNITKNHLIQAINKIDSEGVPTYGDSQYYDVLYNGNKYPPKLIVSYANIFANGVELDRKNFEGGLGTPCFKLLEKEGFVIDKKNNMVNIKLYDIHGKSTIENYSTLITPDEKYFYWDSKRFTRNETGDIVFWVNRTERVVLYTIIDSKDVQQTFSNGRNLINDQDYNVSATAQEASQFETFYRFKIIEKAPMPDGWNYSNLVPFNGQTMAIILYEPNVNEPEKKIEKIKDIKTIFSNNAEVTEILDEALALLQGNNPPVKRSRISQQKKSDSKEMNILTAIKTKPFILLAGISGTGKSRLVRTLAYKTCFKEEFQVPKKPGNFELIPVRPNWHDSSELMGYVSRINGEKYITTSFLQFIAKAWKNKEVPFFLCLDEMNLAPVEQYFAEYLSIIETRQVLDGEIVTDFLISKASFENQALYSQLLKDLGLDEIQFPEGISIPNNLVVIGTVNMDETTHSFSRKVLDRAMTFEMNDVDLTAGLDNSKNDWSYPQEFVPATEVIGEFTSGAEVFIESFKEREEVLGFLQKVNEALEGSPFKIAYRVRDEFLIYCYHVSLNSTDSNWLTTAFDEMSSMKILSRIEGDETKTGRVLSNLQRILTIDFKKSYSKLKEMETRLQSSGYTSFWS